MSPQTSDKFIKPVHVIYPVGKKGLSFFFSLDFHDFFFLPGCWQKGCRLNIHAIFHAHNFPSNTEKQSRFENEFLIRFLGTGYGMILRPKVVKKNYPALVAVHGGPNGYVCLKDTGEAGGDEG